MPYSSRSDDFLYGVGVRTPTAFTNTSACAYCLYVFQDVEMAHMEEHEPDESLEMISAVLVQLTLTKILKIVATRWRILRLKWTTIDFGWGSAPDPAGGAYCAPPDPLAGFGGLLLRGGEGRKGKHEHPPA